MIGIFMLGFICGAFAITLAAVLTLKSAIRGDPEVTAERDARSDGERGFWTVPKTIAPDSTAAPAAPAEPIEQRPSISFPPSIFSK